MNADHGQTSDPIEIGKPPAATAHREEMWAVISASWDAQLARRRHLRVVRTRLGVGCGIAATLLVGIIAGRWSVYTDPAVAPSAPTARTAASLPRQVALHQHLRDVETLLVLFDAEPESQDDLGERARDLAAASRMQIDYSAGQSAEIELLLEDLELLLLQIAHVAAAGDATERDITLAGIREADAIARTRLWRSQDSRLDDI